MKENNTSESKNLKSQIENIAIGWTDFVWSKTGKSNVHMIESKPIRWQTHDTVQMRLQTHDTVQDSGFWHALISINLYTKIVTIKLTIFIWEK